MKQNDITGVAEIIDALEEEIRALSKLDPYDPAIPRLQDRLVAAIHEMYERVPRGV